MRTKVVLTIDTEPSVAGVLGPFPDRKPLLDEAVEGLVGGRSEALGFILDTLARHRLTATFFVEALHTTAFPEGAMGRHVDRILGGGHEVELHFHPVWRSWKDGRLDTANLMHDRSADIPRTELADMLEYGAEQIRRWTGQRPLSARSGTFSTALSVLQASADIGIAYSSHICVAYKPPPEPELSLAGGVHDIAGVRELPVTCFTERGLAGRGLRPLQVNAVSVTELGHILGQMHAAGDPVAIIVTHPFDFLKRKDKQFNGLRPDRLVQARFDGMCAFLAANADRFEVQGFTAAARTLSPAPAPRLDGPPVAASIRSFRNLVNDRMF